MEPTAEEAPLPLGLTAEIAARIEADIIRLRLAPASWLREEDVAARFGVSRSPVREAMRLVEGGGLLVRHPRRGTQVTPIGLDDLDYLTACRVPLESLAAAGAALHAHETQRARIRAALEAVQAARGPEASLDANVALTGAVHAACGNPVLRQILRGIDKQAQRYRYYSYRRLSHLLQASAEANDGIVAAILAGDAVAAETRTETLVRGNWQALRIAFLDERSDPSPAAPVPQSAR